MKKSLIFFLLMLVSAAFAEKQFVVELEIPTFSVTEYHAPYIATWIETSNRKTVVATSLWYDEQTKWLKDIRQWWRKTGRNQKPPYDGVTGATRRPGMHKLKLKSEDILTQLKPGNYVLFIEAAREVGGREVLKIPFEWPLNEAWKQSVQGQQELGKITLTISN